MRKRPFVWTEEAEEYLFIKAKKGESMRHIASMIGCSFYAAKDRYRKICMGRGISHLRKRVTRHSEQTRATVIAMKHGGRTLVEIAAELGLGINQVAGIWNHWRDYSQHRRTA